MPLLKQVEEVNEILNYKDVASCLSYYIYMETQLPKFLQENQSKFSSFMRSHLLLAFNPI